MEEVMAKRLTDSRKWDDDWFLSLPPEFKLLWLYILDKCDHAGIFKVTKNLAEFCLTYKFDWKVVKETFKDRIVVMEEGLWFVPKFITFQYGKLNPISRIHAGIIATLQSKGIDTECIENNTLVKESKPKAMDMMPHFENIWAKYPSRVGKKHAERHFIASVKTQEDLENIKKALDNYLQSERVQKGFIQNGSTWFNNWKDWIEMPGSTEEEITLKKFGIKKR
jgi:hypothetical protein